MNSQEDETVEGDDSTNLRASLLPTGSSTRSSEVEEASSSAPETCIRWFRYAPWCCTLIVALGSFQVGFTGGYSSPTREAMVKDLILSVSQFSKFASLSNVGAIFGAIASGLLAVYVGRRWLLTIASITNISGWSVIFSAKSSWFLYSGRLLEGFGVGIISYTVPLYIAEIAPPGKRGTLGSLHQLSLLIGIFLAYLLGMYTDWRSLALIGMLPCASLLVGLFFIQESPWWENRHNSGGGSSVASDEANEIDRAAFLYGDLRRREYYKPLMIGIGLLVLQQLSGINGILYYASTIFKDAGLQEKDRNVVSCIVAILQVVVTGVASSFLQKPVKRKLLIISSGGMAGALLIVSVAFFQKDYSASSYISSIALVCYVIFFSIGMGAIPWILMSEILPPNIKNLASTAGTFANYCTACVVTIFADDMLKWNAGGTFMICSVFSFLTLIVVCQLGPETGEH